MGLCAFWMRLGARDPSATREVISSRLFMTIWYGCCCDAAMRGMSFTNADAMRFPPMSTNTRNRGCLRFATGLPSLHVGSIARSADSLSCYEVDAVRPCRKGVKGNQQRKCKGGDGTAVSCSVHETTSTCSKRAPHTCVEDTARFVSMTRRTQKSTSRSSVRVSICRNRGEQGRQRLARRQERCNV